MRRTLFERYGGFAKISKVVMSFYDKILGSPLLSPYFEKTDMKRLIDHQTKFISSLMGGPASYTSEHLERVHAHLGITEVAFKESLTLMKETLEDHEFLDEDVQTVGDAMSSQKNHIVAKK
ncbi:MAG TPA: group 1 truncated hemoglobin [Anaerolineales bacterium]|nr:group 1 truncated hemoglobin [Anaerolineales bacterium]